MTEGDAEGTCCPRCELQIAGHAQAKLGEQVWHASCARTCYHCRGELGSQVMLPQEGKGSGMPHHHACAKLRCHVCGHHLPESSPGSQTFTKHPFFGNDMYCPSHSFDGTRACVACCRFEGIDLPAHAELEDGSPLCVHCMSTSVLSNEECLPLLSQAIATFAEFAGTKERLGVSEATQVPLKLVTTTELNEERGGKLGGPASCRGLSTFQYSDRNHSPHLLEVKVQKGLPKMHMQSVLSHELSHVLLKTSMPNAGRNLEHWAEEGVCQLFALLTLQRISKSAEKQDDAVEAASAAQTMLDDPSEVYGHGLRIASDLHSSEGMDSVLLRLRESGTILPQES